MNVELVLRRDVTHVGKAGERVKVARGFARNFLVPRGLAYQITPDNLRRLEFEKRKLVREAEALRDRMKEKAKTLEGKSFTMSEKATEEGHLYGSVDAAAIAKVLRAEGFEIDEKSVILPEPVKDTGIYEIALLIHPDIPCTAKFWIVDENGKIAERKPEPEPEPKPEAQPKEEKPQEEPKERKKGRKDKNRNDQ